ncbi:MAG TPA: hypothetical protein VN976_21830 [Verrucomicrobiae bacterium]|nr:hypothetical protein [Verrucomicrobiae bacterium]
MHARIVVSVSLFIVGMALHTLAQIDAIARAKNSPLNSRVAIFLARWQTVVIRSAWSLAFFTLWLQGQLVAVLNAVNVPLPDIARAVLDLHVGGAVAWMAGYLFDSGLSFVPGLKSSVPPALDSTSETPPKVN